MIPGPVLGLIYNGLEDRRKAEGNCTIPDFLYSRPRRSHSVAYTQDKMAVFLTARFLMYDHLADG